MSPVIVISRRIRNFRAVKCNETLSNEGKSTTRTATLPVRIYRAVLAGIVPVDPWKQSIRPAEILSRNFAIAYR
jgi:hypothetical protein